MIRLIAGLLASLLAIKFGDPFGDARGVSIFDRHVDRMRCLPMPACCLGIAILHSQSQIGKGAALTATVPDLADDHQLLLVILDRPAVLAQVSVGTPQIAERIALATTIPDLASDRQLLLIKLNRSAGFAESGVGIPETTERVALATTVPDLTRNGKGRLVMLDGPAVLAEVSIGNSEIAERVALASAVPYLASDRQLPLQMLNCRANLAESAVRDPEIAERVTLATTVSDPLTALYRRLMPSDLLSRMQPEAEDVGPSVGIGCRQSCCILRRRRSCCGPALSRLDVRPLPVEQRQSLCNRRAALEIKRIHSVQHGSEMFGMALRHQLSLLHWPIPPRHIPQQVMQPIAILCHHLDQATPIEIA